VQCAQPSNSTGLSLEDLGRFTFTIETRDGVRMKGLLDVLLDTIVAQSESAPCRMMPEQESPDNSSSHVGAHNQAPRESEAYWLMS
jgi:hypothetical protein